MLDFSLLLLVRLLGVSVSQISGSVAGPVWTPRLEHPLQYEPNQQDLISYYDFVQNTLYPFPTLEGVGTEEKHKIIGHIKDQRRDLLKKFFHEDHPGVGYSR